MTGSRPMIWVLIFFVTFGSFTIAWVNWPQLFRSEPQDDRGPAIGGVGLHIQEEDLPEVVDEVALKPFLEDRERRELVLDAPFGDNAVKEAVSKLKELRVLYLIKTRITDAGLKEISRLKMLEELYIPGTRITDAGLRELHGLKQLKRIGLAGTRVTREGICDLQNALPDLLIITAWS